MISSRFLHLKAALWKNWLFHRALWKISLFQLLAPSLSLLFLSLLIYAPSPYHDLIYTTPRSISPQTRCTNWNNRHCYSLFVYFYVSEVIDESFYSCTNKILQRYSSQTGLKLEEDIIVKNISDFTSLSEVYTFLSLNPNITDGIVFFHKCSLDVLNPYLEYAIGYNATQMTFFEQMYFKKTSPQDLRFTIQLLINSIFISLHHGRNISIKLSQMNFPILGDVIFDNFIQIFFLPVFIFAGIAMHYPILLYYIVYERENKQREGLQLFGLLSSIYWFSWFVSEVILTNFSFLLFLFFGYLFSFQIFANADPFVLYFILFIFSLSMICFTFFVSNFLLNVQQAMNAGICIFSLGILFVFIFANNFLFAQLFSFVPFFIKFLNIFPPISFAKAFGDILFDSSTFDTFGFEKDLQFFGISSLFRKRVSRAFNIQSFTTKNSLFTEVDIPPTGFSFLFLFFDTFLYIILTWYCDSVSQSKSGRFMRYFAFLIPFYRFKMTFNKIPNSDDSTNDINDAILCQNLTKKIYTATCSKKKFLFKNLSFRIPSNQVVVILGLNGSGKSTLFNIFNGLTNFDHGNLFLCGYDLKVDLMKIRNFSGYCQQYDTLWNDLSAREHLFLFASIKNFTKRESFTQIEFLMESLDLFFLSDKKVSTFSGGMKRRLSIALAFLGNPRIIFLDEPTTGIDTLMKKKIWKLICEKKSSCSFIITSHDINEAEIIANRIILLKDGKIIAEDDSMNVKKNFFGLKLKLHVLPNFFFGLKQHIFDVLPCAFLNREHIDQLEGNYLEYIIPKYCQDKLLTFCCSLESSNTLFSGIQNYDISHETLKDSFFY